MPHKAGIPFRSILRRRYSSRGRSSKIPVSTRPAYGYDGFSYPCPLPGVRVFISAQVRLHLLSASGPLFFFFVGSNVSYIYIRAIFQRPMSVAPALRESTFLTDGCWQILHCYLSEPVQPARSLHSEHGHYFQPSARVVRCPRCPSARVTRRVLLKETRATRTWCSGWRRRPSTHASSTRAG